MTQVQWVRRVVKPAAFLAAGVPFALLVFDIFGGGLGANPIEEITHRTGFWTLTLLTITLSITPARKVLRLNALILLRRMFGVYAFFYACLHFTMYALDRAVFSGLGLTLGALVEDVAERPYVTVGFTAFVLLIPLAITSTKGWVKRLGGKRWQNLHRVVYVSAVGGVLHFWWLVKADTRRPMIFGAVLLVFLGYRVGTWWKKRLPASTQAGYSPSSF
jgi:methionine sulfoxide reductase heme-binding subunit